MNKKLWMIFWFYLLGWETLMAANISQSTGVDANTPWVELLGKTENAQTFLPVHVRVNLAAADIIGMSAAPVQLIPAPGAGKTVTIKKVLFTMTRTATAFTSGGAVIVQYGNTATGGGTQALDSTIASTVVTGSSGTTVTMRNGAVISDLASATGQNAGIFISNQTGAFATGTGTAVVDVWYYVAQ